VEIDLSRPMLARNDQLAARNRERLSAAGVFMLDVLASPGAGKTTTILATLARRRGKVDAEKVKAHGIPAVQINTGGACHLESDMISRALDALPLPDLDLVVVENVGNLVCPTEFDLGQSARIVILSVPEGHDKPLKYPGIFAISDAIVLNKYDTMHVFDFDEGEFRESVRRLNGAAPIFTISAKTGEGLDAWVEWLAARIADADASAHGGPAPGTGETEA
jgi:hydrogenase nickel incorporation protein HypB